ncbi:MAG: tyrosine-type recombinase/integrase [Anaerolineales bacterium]|nr:tyrosine-type recombinase/integrase [Anaerolineales bacterium]MCW5856276.1 tyrosine-type recombinase/integrase [Anaerolineales bacterium]
MDSETTLTIEQAISQYVDAVKLARSENTTIAYHKALAAFSQVLLNEGLDPKETSLSYLKEDSVAWFAASQKHLSPATERQRLTAVAGFFEFLAAERLAEPNLPRVRLLIRQRSRRPGPRLPQFPRQAIEQTVDFANQLAAYPVENETDHLRNLRDRAFIITLADTGLRVHEACNLRRGDLDPNEGKAIIIGKGNREAVVRFSQRALRAIKDYLNARSTLDGSSGRPLGTLPIFARHDKGSAKAIKLMTPTTGRNIVAERTQQALGVGNSGITPHSFRHYFVTTVLRGSGGNLKLAQELARHRNIQVTQRYAHLSDDELDRGYHDIFEN